MALYRCGASSGIKFPDVEFEQLDSSQSSFTITTNENEILLFTANTYGAVTLNSGGTEMAYGYGHRLSAIKPTSDTVNVSISGGSDKNLIRVKKAYSSANAYMNTGGSSVVIPTNQIKNSLAIGWQGGGTTYPTNIKNFPAFVIQNRYAICFAVDDTNDLTMTNNTNISTIVLS